MNQTLLQQLVYKAHVQAYRVHEQLDPVGYASDKPVPPQIVFEQFAELIIQECCTRIQADWQKVEQMPVQHADFEPLAIIAACRTECVAEIKQHCGIPS